jgi:hypothetical protein
MYIQDPDIGQQLLLRREPDNIQDNHAVAVLEDVIVGNVQV